MEAQPQWEPLLMVPPGGRDSWEGRCADLPGLGYVARGLYMQEVHSSVLTGASACRWGSSGALLGRRDALVSRMPFSCVPLPLCSRKQECVWAGIPEPCQCASRPWLKPAPTVPQRGPWRAMLCGLPLVCPLQSSCQGGPHVAYPGPFPALSAPAPAPAIL